MRDKLCLRLTRVIKAPREKCFAAWTNPELMARWFAPTSRIAEATADVRVGGEYRISVCSRPETGTSGGPTVTGVYKEIVPNERITFTWTYPDDPHPETTVSVEFREVEQGTELTLTHQGFETEEVLAQHEEGWESCLNKIEQILQNTDHERQDNNKV